MFYNLFFYFYFLGLNDTLQMLLDYSLNQYQLSYLLDSNKCILQILSKITIVNYNQRALQQRTLPHNYLHLLLQKLQQRPFLLIRFQYYLGHIYQIYHLNSYSKVLLRIQKSLELKNNIHYVH